MPAADPKNLAALKQLTTLLEGINPDNEDPNTGEAYDPWDLRGQVFRGETEFGDEVNYAKGVVTLIEPRAQVDGFSAGYFESERNDPWKLLLHGFVPRKTPHICDNAYLLRAVLVQRLSRIIALDRAGMPAYADDYLLGRKITGLTIHQAVVSGPIQNVSAYAFCLIPLSVNLATNPTNPYAE